MHVCQYVWRVSLSKVVDDMARIVSHHVAQHEVRLPPPENQGQTVGYVTHRPDCRVWAMLSIECGTYTTAWTIVLHRVAQHDVRLSREILLIARPA